MTTRAQKITTPQGFDPNFRKYSDFTLNLDAHPDTGDLALFTNVNAVKKALRNLVLTDKYERLFRPEIGCGIRGLLFENLTGNTLSILKDTIKEVIERYEPRVSIQTIEVIGLPDNNTVIVNLYFAVLNIPDVQFVSISVDRAR